MVLHPTKAAWKSARLNMPAVLTQQNNIIFKSPSLHPHNSCCKSKAFFLYLQQAHNNLHRNCKPLRTREFAISYYSNWQCSHERGIELGIQSTCFDSYENHVFTALEDKTGGRVKHNTRRRRWPWRHCWRVCCCRCCWRQRETGVTSPTKRSVRKLKTFTEW